MKCLIISTITKMHEGGGITGTKRNATLLEKCFGRENVTRYDIPYYSGNFITFLYSFFGYSGGLTPKHIRILRRMVLSESYDMVFFNQSKLGKLAKMLSGSNCVCFFHNVELLFTLARIKKYFFPVKLLYIPVLLAIYRAERAAVKYSGKIITLNSRDSGELRRIYRRAADFLLPISFADRYDKETAGQYDTGTENSLLFVGSSFFGNTEGLFWFIENCMDAINAELKVVGAGMEKYQGKYPHKKVVFAGFVEDLAEYYYRADAVVLPILSGSGMKTKTCEALMYGKTIFGTREAFEGYDALDAAGKGWLCGTADEFIAAINRFLDAKESKINSVSRDIFLKHYSQEAVKQGLHDFIRGSLGTDGRQI